MTETRQQLEKLFENLGKGALGSTKTRIFFQNSNAPVHVCAKAFPWTGRPAYYACRLFNNNGSSFVETAGSPLMLQYNKKRKSKIFKFDNVSDLDKFLNSSN